MSKAVSGVKGLVGKVTGPMESMSPMGNIFGGDGSPGMLGTGRFQGGERAIDPRSFQIQDAKKTTQNAEFQRDYNLRRGNQAQTQLQRQVNRLEGQAAGTAPSLAEAQLKSATDRNLAQQLAAVQANRGGSAASRERQLMQGMAQSGRELSQDAATARMQEAQAAEQLLANQLMQEQTTAENLAFEYGQQGFNVQQAQQKALADLEQLRTGQFLQAQGLTAQGFEGAATRRAGAFSNIMGGASSIMGMFSGSDENMKKNIQKTSASSFSTEDSKKKVKEIDVSSDVPEISMDTKEQTSAPPPSQEKKESGGGIEGIAKLAPLLLAAFSDKATKNNSSKLEENSNSIDKIELDTKSKQTKSSSNNNEKEKKGGMEGLAKMAPMLLSMFSDGNSKDSKNPYNDKNIKKDFLDKLEAYTYEYKDKYKKDPRGGEGTFLSVMAQDLEKAGPIGKSMVKETNDGVKVVDYGKGFGAILAAQAHLNKRLNELDKKKKA